MQSDLKETFQNGMKAAIQSVRPESDETTPCNEETEIKPDPGLMQSIEEHQKIPKEDAAVMPFGGPRKRRRGCNLAAKRRQKRKERTQGNSRFRKKLAAACKRVSRRARVAWRKSNLVRKIRIQINYGPWKRLTITGRKTTSRATVAWHSENVVRKDSRQNEEHRNEEKTAKDSRNARNATVA
jgi:hypothetical protein